MSVSGKWEGKMLDASGSGTRVVLDLEDSGRSVKGAFSVFSEAARDGCGCGSGPQLMQIAAVKGNFVDSRNELKLAYHLDTPKAPVEVVFRAQMKEADPHARRAFVGTYRVSDEGAQIGMEGGACVLWQYAGKREG